MPRAREELHGPLEEALSGPFRPLPETDVHPINQRRESEVEPAVIVKVPDDDTKNKRSKPLAHGKWCREAAMAVAKQNGLPRGKVQVAVSVQIRDGTGAHVHAGREGIQRSELRLADRSRYRTRQKEKSQAKNMPDSVRSSGGFFRPNLVATHALSSGFEKHLVTRQFTETLSCYCNYSVMQ